MEDLQFRDGTPEGETRLADFPSNLSVFFFVFFLKF